MKRFFILAALCVSAFSLASCEYDDNGLWNKIDAMQEQIDTNTEDIATLSALVDALNNGKVITLAEPTENGYRLVFSDGTLLSTGVVAAWSKYICFSCILSPILVRLLSFVLASLNLASRLFPRKAFSILSQMDNTCIFHHL